MSNVKERIIGAVTVMSESDATKVWNLILSAFHQKEWDSIEEEFPDEIDLAMLEEIKHAPDCQEFISSDEVMKILGF